MDIPITQSPTSGPSGTRITLLGLRHSLSFPSPTKLGRLLLREFGRHDDFHIVVNGEQLTADVLEGKHETVELQLDSKGLLFGSLWLLDRPGSVADPGIIIRVQGRAIGEPTFLGLEDDPEIPRSFLRRVYGEIHADHLVDDVQSNWSGFIENSAGFTELREAGRSFLKARLLNLQVDEAGSQPEEFVARFQDEIAKLPPTRRELARQSLYRVFTRFYDEAIHRKEAIAEVVLNALERDEYWMIIQRLDEASSEDVLQLATILETWGLYEVSGVVSRAHQRLEIVERFESIVRDSTTLELEGVHAALRDNLWLVSEKYELRKSNRTMRNVVEDVFGTSYSGEKSRRRPDLILAGIQNQFVIVELKRPSHRITRKDVAQAQEYRDDLRIHLPGGQFEIVVIGGHVDQGLEAAHDRGAVVTTYRRILVEARERLEWLIDHLSGEFEAVA